MKTKTAEQILHKYFHHFKSERTRDLIVKAMEEYRQQPSASQPMSAEQVFPSWEDATKGITDSRFTELPEKNTIRQGARIMYDMLYRMMKSTAPTVKADGWVEQAKNSFELIVKWCEDSGLKQCDIGNKKHMAIYHSLHAAKDALNNFPVCTIPSPRQENKVSKSIE